MDMRGKAYRLNPLPHTDHRKGHDCSAEAAGCPATPRPASPRAIPIPAARMPQGRPGKVGYPETTPGGGRAVAFALTPRGRTAKMGLSHRTRSPAPGEPLAPLATGKGAGHATNHLHP